MSASPSPAVRIAAGLESFCDLVVEELDRILPAGGDHADSLYGPIREHALAAGKRLRPALCLATCRALGGDVGEALPTAAVLELYHCAFLVHDDVEDGSSLRRGAPTLHLARGQAVAINAADAMLAIALEPLLENTRTIGLGPALEVMSEVATMARLTAEGQALELDWIRRGFIPDEDDYVEMVAKKTAAYSFVAPVRIGAIVARAGDECRARLTRAARSMGIAFQIRDDVLNLRHSSSKWGKESCDDLWEGKRTLALVHALAAAAPAEREEARRILAKSRPGSRDAAVWGVIGELSAEGALSADARARLEAAAAPAGVRTAADVELLRDLVIRAGSLDHAERVAASHADEAREALESSLQWLRPGRARELLFDLVDFAVRRDH